jgi:hypothetical protein
MLRPPGLRVCVGLVMNPQLRAIIHYFRFQRMGTRYTMVHSSKQSD